MSITRINEKLKLAQIVTQQIPTTHHWEELVKRDYGHDVDLSKEFSLLTSNWEKYYKGKHLIDFKCTIDAAFYFYRENVPLTESLQCKIDGFLNIAAQHGHEVWFKKAEEVGIDFAKNNQWDACRLTSAIKYGYIRVFTFLIEKKGDQAAYYLHKSNTFNLNSLEMAAQTRIDDPVFLKMIIKICGAKIINQPLNDNGLTLLHYAAIQGNARCLAYLIKNNANLELKATWENSKVTAQEIVEKNNHGPENVIKKFAACMKIFESENVRKLDHNHLGISNLFQQNTSHDQPQAIPFVSRRFLYKTFL